MGKEKVNVIFRRFVEKLESAPFFEECFTFSNTHKRYEQHRKCEDWWEDVLNSDEENIKDDIKSPYKTDDTRQRSKDTELYDGLSKISGILKMMDNSVKCSCGLLAEQVAKGKIGWTQPKDDRKLPTNVDDPLREENKAFLHTISSAEANESEKRSLSKSSHRTRRKYVHVSPAKHDDHKSTSSAGRSAHIKYVCSSLSLHRIRGLLKGWSTYGYYLLIICLLMNPRMSHSYMYNYQPNIECPKDFVAHGNTCCRYIECDPGFQVRTCSSNFTADTCEVCPPGTMSYDPTNSKFVYPCIGVKEECPIDTRPVSFVATEVDPRACSKRCQCNTTANYCGTDPCRCRVGHCEKHYQLQQGCGCMPTRKESRSTDMTTTGTSNDESTWVRETEMNKTTIFDLMNQTTSSTSILLSTLHSKNELSPPIATKAAKTNITTTKPTKTPQPPVMYDKQKPYIHLLAAHLVTVCTLSILVAGLTYFCICRKATAQLNETSDRTFACYGTANSLLSPSCPSGSLVAPYQVSAGTKTNTTGCPREIVDPAQAALCCVFDSDDCHGEYLNMDSQGTSFIYHADCVGRENCVGFAGQASTMDIKYLTCSPSFTYPDETNYMFMDYFCIPGARIGTMSSANIQSSTDMIYLRGQDYTTSGIAVTSASCSVESDDCNVIISVYALDLRLANDSTGACTQELSLSGTVFDCSDDNNFKINEIFQSSNNYINVNFSSTVTNDGYFWIGFNTSSSSSDILTLRCPAQSQQTVCTTTTTTTTTTESTTVATDLTTEMSTDNSTDHTGAERTTEMANTTMQHPTRTQEGKHDDTGIIIGCVCAALFIVPVIVVFSSQVYRKKCKSKPMHEENSQSHKKVPPSYEEVSPQQNDTGYTMLNVFKLNNIIYEQIDLQHGPDLHVSGT